MVDQEPEIQHTKWSKDHLYKSVSRLKFNSVLSDIASLSVYEFGVYRAETMKMTEDLLDAYKIPYHRMFGLDSFEGLPHEAPGIPHHHVFSPGAFNDIPFLFPVKGKLIKCWFGDLTATDAAQHDMTAAKLVHIDCDLYISARQALTFMFENRLIVPGTIICYDEFKSTPKLSEGGESKAHREICEKYNVDMTEFFRNTYNDGTLCWQNAFVVNGFDRVNYGVNYD